MKKLFLSMALASVLFFGCDPTTPIPPNEDKEFSFVSNVEVGSQPAGIYYDESKQLFHIFCLGKDVDYDGTKDPEDENPSWWIINKADLNNPVKKMEFDWGFMGFPFRPYIEFTSRKLYISQNGLVKIYNMDSFTKTGEIGGNYYASAISGNKDYLFLSVPEYQKNGHIVVLNIKTQQMVSSTLAGLQVQQNKYFEVNAKQMLAVLNEGDGNDNSMIQFFELNSGQLNLLKQYENLGKTANHFAIYKNRLVVTLNVSHQLLVFDLDNLSLTKNISTKTSGFDGPREVVFNSENDLFVTSYAGDIRQFNLSWGQLDKTMSTDSKAEGIAIIPNELMLVANISKSDYSANNKISVFTAK